MSRRRFTHDGLDATFMVNLGRVATPEQAKERGTIRPAFFRLQLFEPEAEPDDSLVDLWEQVDIDLTLSDEDLQALITAKRDELLEQADKQVKDLKTIRETERSTERRIEKVLERVA